MPFEIPAALGPILPLALLLAVLVVVRGLLRRLLDRAVRRERIAAAVEAAPAGDDLGPRRAA